MARAAFYGGIGLVVLLYGIIAWQRWHSDTASASAAAIHILDVGQGDAIHIRTLTGDDVLIDGGPDATVVQRLGEVIPFWDRTIELVILSHPDADHLAGLMSVFEYYDVERIAYEPLPATTDLRHEFHQLLAQQPTIILALQAGDELTLSPHETIDILYPDANTPLAQLPTNDTSIVVLYEFFGATTTSFLSLGDMSSEIEDQLVQRNRLPDVDILKVSHHGSKYSSSTEFLAAVNPAVALISVGQDNSYGHPHADALERLFAASHVYRTDQLGTISIRINNDGYHILP